MELVLLNDCKSKRRFCKKLDKLKCILCGKRNVGYHDRILSNFT